MTSTSGQATRIARRATTIAAAAVLGVSAFAYPAAAAPTTTMSGLPSLPKLPGVDALTGGHDVSIGGDGRTNISLPAVPTGGVRKQFTNAPAIEQSTHPKCAPFVFVGVPGTFEINRDDPANKPVGMLAKITDPLSKALGDKFVPTMINYDADAGVNGTSYKTSVDRGVKKTLATVTDVASRCPTSSIILGGYSQGANVAGDVATDVGQKRTPVDPARIGGVVLVADPQRTPNSNVIADTNQSRPDIPSFLTDAVGQLTSNPSFAQLQMTLSKGVNSFLGGTGITPQLAGTSDDTTTGGTTGGEAGAAATTSAAAAGSDATTSTAPSTTTQSSTTSSETPAPSTPASSDSNADGGLATGLANLITGGNSSGKGAAGGDPIDAPSSSVSADAPTTSESAAPSSDTEPTTSTASTPAADTSHSGQKAAVTPITQKAVAGGGIAGKRDADFGALKGRVVSLCVPGDIVCSLPENSELAQDLVKFAKNVSVDFPDMASTEGATRMGGLLAVQGLNTVANITGLPQTKLSADTLQALINIAAGAGMLALEQPAGAGLIADGVAKLPDAMPEIFAQIADIPALLRALPNAGKNAADNTGLSKLLARVTAAFESAGMTSPLDIQKYPQAANAMMQGLVKDNTGLVKMVTNPQYWKANAHVLYPSLKVSGGTGSLNWVAEWFAVLARAIGLR